MPLLIVFLVLVVGIIVWVLVNVFKSSQEQSKPVQRRTVRTGGQSNTPKVERNSTSDIDRFLMEIDRLRKKDPEAATSEKPQQFFAQKPQPARENTPKPKPVRERERERERESRSNARPTQKPKAPSRSTEQPVLTIVNTPTEAPKHSATSQPSAFPESVSRTSSVVSSASLPEVPKLVAEIKFTETREAESMMGISAVMAGTAPKLPKSPVADLVRDLMKSQKGKAAAVILAEIFGPPPARRK